jgi:polyribonucleotide nucleotidyltransferase
MDAALQRIKDICAVPEVGTVYHGKVVSILEFGAFVEILPGKEGLLHISELDWKKTDKVEDILQVGDMVDVKLLEIDEKTGKMRLSRRALIEKPEGYVEPERRPRGNGNGNRGGGERRDGGRGERRGNGERRDNSGRERHGDKPRHDGPRKPRTEPEAPKASEPDVF